MSHAVPERIQVFDLCQYYLLSWKRSSESACIVASDAYTTFPNTSILRRCSRLCCLPARLPSPPPRRHYGVCLSVYLSHPSPMTHAWNSFYTNRWSRPASVGDSAVPRAFRPEGDVRTPGEQGQVEAQRSCGSFGLRRSGWGQRGVAARRGGYSGGRPHGDERYCLRLIETRVYVGGMACFPVALLRRLEVWVGGGCWRFVDLGHSNSVVCASLSARSHCICATLRKLYGRPVGGDWGR